MTELGLTNRPNYGQSGTFGPPAVTSPGATDYQASSGNQGALNAANAQDEASHPGLNSPAGQNLPYVNDPYMQPASHYDTGSVGQQPPLFSYDLNGVNPSADLQYNAALRGYGLDASSARAQADYQRKSLNAQLQGAIPGMEQARGEGIVNDKESAANRGAIRSSSNLLSQDMTNRGVNTQEAALRAGIADKQAQLTFGLQDQLNSTARQQSEAELSARMRLLDQKNQQAAYDYYNNLYGDK